MRRGLMALLTCGAAVTHCDKVNCRTTYARAPAVLARRRRASGRDRDTPGPLGHADLRRAGPTASGIEVSPETALRCPPVLGAIRVLSETVQQLPVHLYRRTDDGGRERADAHPVEALLADAANEWLPASEFRLAMQTQLALHGNAYAWVGRTASGVAVEMIPLDPRTVSVEPDRRTMAPVYVVTDADGQRRATTAPSFCISAAPAPASTRATARCAWRGRPSR